MSLQTYLSTFLLIAQSYNVMAQCRVEFVSPPATLSTTSYVQPTGQFVIPAVIKPLIDTTCQPPSVPSFPDFNSCNYPAAMPPICVSRNDDDDFRSMLYCLIYALASNRLGNGGSSCGGCGCGGNGGFGGNCGCGGGYGNGGGYGCGGNFGCGGGSGCGGNFGYGGGCSCGGNNGFNGGCGCGNGYGCGGGFGCGGGNGYGGGCSCNGNSGCGGFGFDGGYCGCGGYGEFSFGNGVTYIPYPIIIPTNCGSPNGMYCDQSSNCDCCGQGPTLQASNGKDTNEINLRIITDGC